MKEREWKKLCRNIFEKNCILVLGSQFPLELIKENQSTTFEKLLSSKMKEELQTIERLPVDVLNNLDKRELFQLTSDFINFKGVDQKLSREDLEWLLDEHLRDLLVNVKSECFQKLCSLPFTFIINTNYSDFFGHQLHDAKKLPTKDYFNFRTKKGEGLSSLCTEFCGTENHPFVYNLFGSISNLNSLVLSETDVVDLAINIISNNPGLPGHIKSQLSDPEKIFLFLGFSFLNKTWYFRILLQALQSQVKSKMSYALECFHKFNTTEEATVNLFKDELKVSLYDMDQKEFIDTLLEQYNSCFTGIPRPIDKDSPRVFISYKSEDYEKVKEICFRLKQEGINTWLDKERLQGKWETKIIEEIFKSDAFILIHSQQLKDCPVTYVNVEIKEALARAKYYPSEADFIFPAYIDRTIGATTESTLSHINFYDLTAYDKIDQLAKDIKQSYERNKRRYAA
jgi:hypothetical protein